jgi:hypothetical protein
MIDQNRNKYYAKFGLKEFINVKESLKSLPVFLNNVYFLKTYANALWNADKEENFDKVIVLCEESKLDRIKSIINTNFLYRKKWDSINYTDDISNNYGFSFILSNVKIMVGTYKIEGSKATIKLFDVNTNIATITTLDNIDSTFKTTSINSKGEIIKIIDFDINNINGENTKRLFLKSEDDNKMITID